MCNKCILIRWNFSRLSYDPEAGRADLLRGMNQPRLSDVPTVPESHSKEPNHRGSDRNSFSDLKNHFTFIFFRTKWREKIAPTM